MKRYRQLTNSLILGVIILALFFGMRGGWFDGMMSSTDGQASGEGDKEEVSKAELTPEEQEEIKAIEEAAKEIEEPQQPAEETDTVAKEAPKPNKAYHELHIRKRAGILEYQVNGDTHPELIEGLEGLDLGKKFIVTMSGSVTAGEEKSVKALLESHQLDYTIQDY